MNPTAALVPLLGLGWGLNWPAVRLCLVEIPPWTLRACGLTLGALVLFGFILARGGSVRVPRRDWGTVAIVGTLTVTAFNLLSAFAQLSASTTRSAVLAYTMPIWTVLLARIFLGERLDARRIVGLGLGVAGLVALGWPLLAAGEFSRGIAFAVGSGFVWAAGSTVLKRRPVAASPPAIAAWQLALGGVTAAFGMLAVEGVPAARALMPVTLAAFGFHVVIAQAAATAMWFTILDGLPAGVAAIGSLLVPGVGVIGATLILGERPTIADWTGLALIVAASATVLLRFGPGPAR